MNLDMGIYEGHFLNSAMIDINIVEDILDSRDIVALSVG